jgi:hypothetical protein
LAPEGDEESGVQEEEGSLDQISPETLVHLRIEVGVMGVRGGVSSMEAGVTVMTGGSFGTVASKLKEGGIGDMSNRGYRRVDVTRG